MLDRQVVEEFLGREFEEGDWEIPDDIPNWKIYEALYVLQEDGLIPVKNMTTIMSG